MIKKFNLVLNPIILCLIFSFTCFYVNAAVKKTELSIESKNKTEKINKKTKKVDISKHQVSDEEIKNIKVEAQVLKKKWDLQVQNTFSLATTKRFERAQKYLTKGDFKHAIDLVQPVINRRSSNGYEKAKALIIKTQAYMSMREFLDAEVTITQAITIGELSYGEQCEALMFLAQIHLVAQNYKAAKLTLIKYIEVVPDKVPAAHIMLGTIENELGDLKSAEKHVDQALSESDDPQEPWLYFASVIYLKTKNFAKAEMILKNLLEKRQNNKNYWMTLIGVLFEEEKTTEALQYLELAHKQGFITASSDINNRAALLSQEKIPFKAAIVLKQAIINKDIPESQKAYEFMASFWFVAKEYSRAIEAYKKASALSDSGSVELLLGQVYLEQEDWVNAEKSFQAAVKKGNLKNQEGSAVLGLGMTAYFQDDKISALKYFAKAQKFKQQKEAASRWIGFLK